MDDVVILKKLKDLEHRVEDLERKLSETHRKAEEAAADATWAKRQIEDLSRGLGNRR